MNYKTVLLVIAFIWIVALQIQLATLKTTADDAYSLSDDAYSVGREASLRVEDACAILRNGC